MGVNGRAMWSACGAAAKIGWSSCRYLRHCFDVMFGSEELAKQGHRPYFGSKTGVKRVLGLLFDPMQGLRGAL